MAKASVNSASHSPEVRKLKKEKCREKEYRRAQSINAAFDTLQKHIPYLKNEERKCLPKIKTLRLAMQYIDHLKKLVNGNEMTETDCNESRPLTHSDFRNTVTNEMRIRNSYRERAHSQEMDQATVQRILAREEQRRRCISFPNDNQRLLSQQIRQFGPISANVYNFRQINENQFSTTYEEFQAQPPHNQYQASMFHSTNEVNYDTSVRIVDQYMVENNYPHFQ